MSNSVMQQIIDPFEPLAKWRIDHKRLWMEYLETGKLPFSAEELHNTLWEIIDRPGNRPRGDKLLCFRKRNNFTLKENKIPYRPEEALERFIVVSNGDHFFNQFPIGGGKESVDIVVRHKRDLLEFVELKPWNSGDSPLYALVESLKNLIEYRVIIERQIQDVKELWGVDVSLLAPSEYYRNFFLLDDSGSSVEHNINRVAELLGDFAEVFETNISIRSFGLTVDRFNQACSRLYDQQRLVGQGIASVSDSDAIGALEMVNWVELAGM